MPEWVKRDEGSSSVNPVITTLPSSSSAITELGRDAIEVGIPWGGLILLFCLAGVAVALQLAARGRFKTGPGAWLTARLQRSSSQTGDTLDTVEVTSSARLDTAHQVHLVRVGRRHWLLASSMHGSVTVVDRLDISSGDVPGLAEDEDGA